MATNHHYFATEDTAEEAARKLYPYAQDISMINYSSDNIVALIDKTVALRFPKNEPAYRRSLYEKNILSQLEAVETIAIPRILNQYETPPCLETTFLIGKHVSAVDVRAFSKAQQRNFANQVARFAYTMHSTFSLKKEIPLRNRLGLDDLHDFEPWSMYLKKTVFDYDFNDNVQNGIAKNYYDDWAKICNVEPTVIVHDDLHTQNMMFKGSALTGILDFADTNVGTPEQDLRQLYRINEYVVKVAIEEYQRLSGKKLNVDAIKLWAILQELAVYSKSLSTNKTSHHTFKRAARNLNEWLGGEYWGKGHDIADNGVSQ